MILLEMLNISLVLLMKVSIVDEETFKDQRRDPYWLQAQLQQADLKYEGEDIMRYTVVYFKETTFMTRSGCLCQLFTGGHGW